jgi:hypothetical protein
MEREDDLIAGHLLTEPQIGMRFRAHALQGAEEGVGIFFLSFRFTLINLKWLNC